MWDNNAFDTNKLHFLEYGIQHGQIDVPEVFDLSAIIRYDIESGLILNSNINDKLIKADFTVTIITDKNANNQNVAKASFHIYYIFKVDNFEELTAILENGTIELAPILANAIASVTYSTSRGILLTRLQGTAFENFKLPIINPSRLLKI